ncbi:MAG: Asp-tRNA(Asn)/Glu-tRNA(Gln) amidotransferase GatCAB subunit B, partial [Bdellovibrionia bacterium]
TRTYDSEKNITISMRSKEEAQDYRYFPEPDLIPLHLEAQWVEELKKTLPELPEQKRNRLMMDLGLSPYDAGVLTSSKSMVEFFEKALAHLTQRGMDPKAAAKPTANWMTGEVARLLNETSSELESSLLTPLHIADVVQAVQTQVLSSTGAKQVVSLAWKTGDSVSSIIDREGLKQVSDAGAILPVIDQVIADFPQQVAEYRSGKEKLLGFFVGQVMKQTGGKANPALLGEWIKKKLSG